MQGPFYDNEVTRRRAGRNADDDAAGETKKKPLKADWKDVFAMTIAAYQILLPMLAVVVGVLLLFLLLFKLWAH